MFTGRGPAADHRAEAGYFYSKQDWFSAFTSCDKCISLGLRDITVYTIKAAALTHLWASGDVVWRAPAIATCEMIAKRWPESFDADYRMAEVYRLDRKFDEALGAIARAGLRAKTLENREMMDRAKHRDEQIRAHQADVSWEEVTGRQHKSSSGKLLLANKALAEMRRIERSEKKDHTHLLKDDILFCIVRIMLRDNPNAAVALGNVKRHWRELFAKNTFLWDTLVIGTKRPIQKIVHWIARNPNIKTIKFASDRFGGADPSALGEALKKGCIENVKNLEFTGHPSELISALQTSCKSLERLVFTNPEYYTIRNPYIPVSYNPEHGLLHPSCRIKEFHDAHNKFIFFDSKIAEDVMSQNHTVKPKRPAKHLEKIMSELRVLNLEMCSIRVHDTILTALYHNLPGIESVTLHGCDINRRSHVSRPRVPNNAKLAKLTSWTENEANFTTLRFADIDVPGLLHLDLSNSVTDNSRHGVVPQLFASGLRHALCNLRSLDFSRCIVHTPEILKALLELPSLQFLNVSFTELGNDFLVGITRGMKASDFKGKARVSMLPQAASSNGSNTTELAQVYSQATFYTPVVPGVPGPITTVASLAHAFDHTLSPMYINPITREEKSVELLPNLIALSMASTNIDSCTLRDFVRSRTARLPTWRDNKATPTPGLTKRSAFMPTSSSRAPGPRAYPSIASGQLRHADNAGAASSASRMDQRAPPSDNGVDAAAEDSPVTLKWLNVDHCLNVDFALTDEYKLHLPFISHHAAATTVNEARIKGQGKWNWQAGWSESCRHSTDRFEGKCTLRKVSGFEDKYEVFHTCAKASEPLLPDFNPWASQPSQSESDAEAACAEPPRLWDPEHLLEIGNRGPAPGPAPTRGSGSGSGVRSNALPFASLRDYLLATRRGPPSILALLQPPQASSSASVKKAPRPALATAASSTSQAPSTVQDVSRPAPSARAPSTSRAKGQGAAPGIHQVIASHTPSSAPSPAAHSRMDIDQAPTSDKVHRTPATPQAGPGPGPGSAGSAMANTEGAMEKLGDAAERLNRILATPQVQMIRGAEEVPSALSPMKRSAPEDEAADRDPNPNANKSQRRKGKGVLRIGPGGSLEGL